MKPTRELKKLAAFSLISGGTSRWLELADSLGSATPDRPSASALLRTIWATEDRSHYRSKIALLAHPINRKVFGEARQAGVGINDLLVLARGNGTFDGTRVIRTYRDSRGTPALTARDRLSDDLNRVLNAAKKEGLKKGAVERLFEATILEVFKSN